MESATCCGMESAQGAGWNHGNAVYGIKPQELYSIRASRNAMRDFVGVPYNARGALIPYQACGLDNQKRNFWLVAEVGLVTNRLRALFGVIILFSGCAQIIYRFI